MDSLDRMLKGVDALIEEVKEPRAFFLKHLDRYLAIAKTVARQTLQAMEPEGSDDAKWDQHIEYFLAAIFSESMAHGFSIKYQGRAAAQDAKGVEPGSSAATEDVTWYDVLEWVDAGVAGDPDGKDITEYDEDEISTAHRVHRVISEDYDGDADYSAIRQRLNDWVNRETDQSFNEFLSAILKAWETALVPIIEDDYNDYVLKLVSKL